MPLSQEAVGQRLSLSEDLVSSWIRGLQPPEHLGPSTQLNQSLRTSCSSLAHFRTKVRGYVFKEEPWFPEVKE